MKKIVIETTDRERLDWLETFVRNEHSLTLHDGSFVWDFEGAGLSFGNRMKRSLRVAIDRAAGFDKRK